MHPALTQEMALFRAEDLRREAAQRSRRRPRRRGGLAPRRGTRGLWPVRPQGMRGNEMIARVWTGATRASDADAYGRYLEHTGVRDMLLTTGNGGVWVLRRVSDDRADFIVASLWRSARHLRGFAGKDLSQAVYYPEDSGFLLDPSETAEHYEVLLRQ